MPIELRAVIPRHARRVRLLFTNTLAIGAFGVSPGLYTIKPTSALGSAVGVSAALVVPDEGTAVELALDADLLFDGTYTITAIGVPAVDMSTSTGVSTQVFHFGSPQSQPNVDFNVDDGGVLLYGTDIVWSGTDFLETASGDLSRVSGVENVVSAVNRRMLSTGLPWNPGYGVKPRLYVDSPVAIASNLRTVMLAQAARDLRVKAVSVDIVTDDSAPDQVTYAVRPTLIGGETPSAIPISITLP